MSPDFNWQMEDDVTWDDLGPVTETAVSRRRPWLSYLFIVIGLVIAGTVAYRQVSQRVETGMANASNDILASHNLIQQASLENDADLFVTLLSGRSKTWSNLQTEAVEGGLLYERKGLGLTWLSPSTIESLTLADVESGAAGIKLEINPELQAAELAFNQEYVIAVGNGVTETVILQQTAVYRRGSQRWLLAPPDTDFWGEYATNRGSVLTLAYPERDKTIAEKLAFDLDAKLNEMCRTLPNLGCSDDLRVHLRLDNDPQSLIGMLEPMQIQQYGLRLELPAPTLMGLPVDEAGYEALLRGYAALTVTAVIADLVGYDCCERAVFFHALVDNQLSQLGLRPWPVTVADYTRVIGEGVWAGDLSRVWRWGDSDILVSGDGWKVYTAVDYLIQRFPEMAVSDMQRAIPDHPDFIVWVSRLTLESSPDTSATVNLVLFGQEWRQYAIEQILANLEPPPIPLPKQDIYLSCPGTNERDSLIINLHRLDPDSMTWTEMLNNIPASYVNPLPQKDGLVIQSSFGFDDETPTTTIWQLESSPLVMANDHISLGQFEPAGRLLAYDLGQGNLVPTLIDVTDCPDGSCPLFPLSGLPVWSPDGSDFILLPETALAQDQLEVNGRFYLFNQEQPPQEWPLHRGGAAPVTGSSDEMIYIGPGYVPFWLDETTYGYVRQVPISSNSTDHELVLASTMDDQPRSLLTEDALLAASPEEERPSNTNLDIYIVMRHPTQPNLLFILAFGPSQMAYLFSYDLAEDVLAFHFRTGIVNFHSLGMSPDGRFLTLVGRTMEPRPSAVNQILLYDITRREFELFGINNSYFAPANIYDWSADGEWLAIILDDLGLFLVAPTYDYQQLIPHSLGQCTDVIWLNK